MPIPNIQSVQNVKSFGQNKVQIADISNAREKKIKFFESSNDEMSEDEENDPPWVLIKVDVDNWVVMQYDDNVYPGCVTKVTEGKVEVAVMHRSEGNFK